MAFVATLGRQASAVDDQPADPWSLPPLAQAISVRDTAAGETVAFTAMLDRLAAVDAVFLGESHTDETTHRLQLEIYRQLLQRRSGRVALAMEMFTRDAQAVLDDYLAGKIDEAEFLKQSNPWNNYREAYRPLVEHAKDAGAPVVASNFPARLIRQFAMSGADALESLSPEDRLLVPRQYFPNSAAYWKRVDNAVRGHRGMTGGGSPEERLYSTQSLWDNSMGEACADALDRLADHSVLHVNGGFHSSFRDGTVRQFQLRKPEASVATVAIVPTSNPQAASLRGKPSADFVVFVEARATNINRGKRAVQVGVDLKYILHLPETQDANSKLPLLIWLPRRGLTAEEELEYCRILYGDECAIAVVEPLHRETGRDGVIGGRWFWDDDFASDMSAAAAGIEEIWAYLSRHFPVDSRRVCVAGYGTAATVAAVVATHSDRVPVQAVAIGPREYSQAKDLPLQLPEYLPADAPPKSLVVMADGDASHQWWEGELAQYEAVGVRSRLEEPLADPWQRQQQDINLVRSALGLPEREMPKDAHRAYALQTLDSARAEHWLRLQALWNAESTGRPTVTVDSVPEQADAIAIQVAASPKSARKQGGVPKCPGPFGGTTILVLPDGTPPEVESEWLEVEANDPLSAKSRFHRTRIATGVGERTLSAVLKKLLSENRKNVLIVPAQFYAEPLWWDAQRSSGQEFNDEMTIQWLPGLGGQRLIHAPQPGSKHSR